MATKKKNMASQKHGFQNQKKTWLNIGKHDFI